MKTRKMLLLAATVGLSFTACKKDSVDPIAKSEEKNAMTVQMTDNASDYLGLEMEITKVEAYLQDSGWVVLNAETKIVDVATLINGKEFQLAHKSNLKAGNYTKIKITFGTNNKLTFKADASDGSNLRVTQETALMFSGSREIEISINVNVDATNSANVLIDFDIAKSVIVVLNKYYVKPVVKWLKDTKTGLKGKVQGSVNTYILITNGTDTFSTYTSVTGEFQFKGIKHGSYKLIAYPIKKLKDELIDRSKKIEGILVAENEVTIVGTITIL